jgi:hypothetical protein
LAASPAVVAPESLPLSVARHRYALDKKTHGRGGRGKKEKRKKGKGIKKRKKERKQKSKKM